MMSLDTRFHNRSTPKSARRELQVQDGVRDQGARVADEDGKIVSKHYIVSGLTCDVDVLYASFSIENASFCASAAGMPISQSASFLM